MPASFLPPSRVRTAFRVLIRHAFVLALALGPAAQATQYAIIKADDFKFISGSPTGITQSYEKFITIVKNNQVKAGIGVICNHLDKPNAALFVARCQQLASDSRFELWNHGYTSDQQEFQGPSVSEQLQQLNLCRIALKNKVGIYARAFGAGGNNEDANTYTAMAQYNAQTPNPDDDIKLWFYVPDPLPPGVISVTRTNLEWNDPANNINHKVDLQRFINEYNSANFAKEVICIQLHPGGKSDQALADIDAAIKFLKSKGAVFVTPYEYYLIKTGTPPAPPAAPTNLTATAVSSNEINLTWQHPSTDETGFDVQRDLDSSFTAPDLVTDSSTGPGSNLSYQSSGLSPGTTYFYRVRAYNDSGPSAYNTPAVSATTDPTGGGETELVPVGSPDSTPWDTSGNNGPDRLWDGVTADGGNGTRWASNASPSTLTTSPRWIVLDLGASFNLTKFVVYPYQSRAYHYKIHVSEDGVNWAGPVVEVQQTIGAASYTHTLGTPAAGRYVRLTVDGISNSSTTWASINELDIFGQAGVNSVPSITTTMLPDATVGIGYSQTLVATGGDGTLMWTLDSGTLPAGLSLSAGGVISGTPTTAATYNFTVRVADSDGNTGATDEGTQALSITIDSGGGTPIVIDFNGYVAGATTSTDDSVGSIGLTGASGNDAVRFLANGPSGDWVQFSIPSETIPAGAYAVSVRVRKANSMGKYQLSIDGTNQGTPQNLYSASGTFAVLDLGTVQISGGNNRLFQFTCTGRDPDSSNYTLTLDTLTLTP